MPSANARTETPPLTEFDATPQGRFKILPTSRMERSMYAGRVPPGPKPNPPQSISSKKHRRRVDHRHQVPSSSYTSRPSSCW